jgi:hypothetical protein
VTSRTLTTTITLVVLVAILVVGLVLGVNSLFAPLPETDDAASTPTCETNSVQRGDRLRSREVAVNVFNAGTRAGLAGQTLESLTARGFVAGTTGNAPETAQVQRVQVWVVEGELAAGRLVARNFGPRTPVMESEDLAEGGVDVVVGDNFKELKRPLRTIRVRAAEEFCALSPAPELG